MRSTKTRKREACLAVRQASYERTAADVTRNGDFTRFQRGFNEPGSSRK